MPSHFDEDPVSVSLDPFPEAIESPFDAEPDPYQEINERRARVENPEALRNVRSL